MKNFINRLLSVISIIGIVIVINFACCDAKKINKNTKKIEKQIDSTKTGKRFKRIDERNGLQP